MPDQRKLAIHVASTTLIGLIVLSVAWEMWLAPLRPGGSWLVLKAVPLLFPLRGVLHGRHYTCQWTSLLSLVYIAEGAVRLSSDPGVSRYYAFAEAVMATVLFASVIAVVRLGRRAKL